MEETTVSDGIPDSMQCLHEENKKLHIDNGTMNVRECIPVPDTPLKLMEMSVSDDLDRRATFTGLDTYDG